MKENDPSRFLSDDNFNYHHFVFSFVSLLAGPGACWPVGADSADSHNKGKYFLFTLMEIIERCLLDPGQSDLL